MLRAIVLGGKAIAHSVSPTGRRQPKIVVKLGCGQLVAASEGAMKLDRDFHRACVISNN